MGEEKLSEGGTASREGRRKTSSIRRKKEKGRRQTRRRRRKNCLKEGKEGSRKRENE